MSSTFYGAEYQLQGKWVAKDEEMAEFSGECLCIEVDDPSAPNISYERVGEEYYPQTLRSWSEDQLHWEIDDEVFTLHVLYGPGKLESPYQKYVTIENRNTESIKRYKLVEITDEEYENHREWYQSVEDQIWCEDSQWESLPTKDRVDNEDVSALSANENGFVIKGTTLYRYDESVGGPMVTIPNGIRRIETDAFRDCQGVTDVYIPDSVSSMGDRCFKGCKNLVNVRLPEGLTQINDDVFCECVSLQEIHLPNTVTSIGRDGFAFCQSLEDVVMPEALTWLGTRAFSNATGLKKVMLNSTLNKIEFAAFSNCTGLTEIHIPASVTDIDTYAFNGCSNLERLTVEDGSEAYCSENNCLIDRENKAILLACNDSVIPDDGSVERIYDRAFSNCKKMESLVVPETVTGISQYAFSGCSALRTIQLPKSLPNGYGDGLFEHCSSLERFEIPEWMTDISMGMFMNCESLKEIKIPDFVTNIGVRAFSGCKALTELVIPKSVKHIGSILGMGSNSNFIEGCTSLRKLEVEAGNPVYHSKDNCIIETKTDTLFAISENGVIPHDGSVTKIGNHAFCACENITEISLPACITEIGSYAFSKLKHLKNINIPTSVTDMGSDVFTDRLGECVPDVVEEENGMYYVGNWALGLVRRKLERTGSEDLFSPVSEAVLPDSGAITIREGTVGICANAFSNSKLQTVALPDSLAYIGANAFNSCNQLRSITLPAGVKKIGDYAFNACSGLESVVFSEGLVRIGSFAFNCCRNLKSVVIPRTVTDIGEDAFRFCGSLETLVIPDVEMEIGRDAFGYCGDIPTMDVPERLRETVFCSSPTEEDAGEYEDEVMGDGETFEMVDYLPF